MVSDSDLSGPLSNTFIDLTVRCIDSLTVQCQMTAKLLDERTGTQEQLINEAKNSISEANTTLKIALAIGKEFEIFLVIIILYRLAEMNASVAVADLQKNLSSLQSIANETIKLQNGVRDTIGRVKLSLSRVRQIISQVSIFKSSYY